ncbi:pectin acetylesterase-family hydrolase [Bernardetia sp. ABR2-2B]|uniref:pectin acetylesterase-family hydrolase n=1 Tax=Bernardetia sp. ABR2-2B TaxID=3127472 RepID=UPI0030D4C7FE
MTRPKIGFITILTVILLAFLMSCSDKDKNSSDTEPNEPLPFQELYDQGIDRYLGTITPISSTTTGAVTEHTFSSVDGPVCFTGNEFSMFTRDGSSDNLLIFLQGGGFCSPVACAAIPTPIPLIPFGILSPSDSQNPTANYNVGYVPYCDGSSMMGDNEVDSDGDGVNDRFFKGIQNLSASFDVIFKKYPSPNKIVLAGNSAGGFAVHAALPLVRKLYPNTKIEIINDSGLGILDTGGMETLIEYWNASAFFPASCTECIGTDGNLTDYHKYQLNQDPNIRLAYISSKRDSTFAAITTGGAAAFETQLLEATSELNTAFPNRFGSLIADGNDHTFLLRRFDFEIGGVTVKDWLSQMLNEEESWESLSD